MDPARDRLRFLLATVALEAVDLVGTDSRLFADPSRPNAQRCCVATRYSRNGLMPPRPASPGCRKRPATSCFPPC